MPITLLRINPRNLPIVADAFVIFPGAEEVGLATLVETDEAEARNLIEVATLLGMVVDDGLSEIATMIEHASVVDRRTLLRHFVERFPPYGYWKRRIAQGFDPLDAARQTKGSFEITNSAADTRDWFLSLGTFCGSVQEDGVKINPVSGKTIDLGSVVSDVLNRGESAVASLENYLGPVLWGKLPQAAMEHLVRAVEQLANNAPSDEVVRSVGLALDAYLTDVGEVDVGNYSNQNLTLGQVVQRLLADGVIVAKQSQALGYALAVRNAAEHPDTDGDLNGDSWTITTKTGQTYLRVALDLIRSVDAKRENRFEF